MAPHEGPPRFDPDADTLDDVARYYQARATQGLFDGLRPASGLEPLVDEGITWGGRAWAVDAEGVRRQSVYVLTSQRGRGHLSRHLARDRRPYVTTPGCGLEAIFERHGVDWRLVGAFTRTREYRAVAAALDRTWATRSGLHHMNHLDEGLAVLRDLGADDATWRAWCLHPLLQADDALAALADEAGALTDDVAVMLRAMEYRSVANAYLSRREVRGPEDVRRSPVAAVQDMLRADKVQNYKDFLLHHRGVHPRSEALERYFVTWLRRLEVSRGDFLRWFERLQATVTPRDVEPARW